MKELKGDEQPVSREVDEAAEADDARRVILARRARFVALALASAGVAAACGGETSGDTDQATGSGGMQATGGEPQVCLQPPITGGVGGFGGSIVTAGTGGIPPQVCLEPPLAGAGGIGGFGGVAGAGAVAGAGGLPQVCLGALPPDAGTDSGDAAATGGTGGATGTGGAGGLPQVCLSPPIDPPEPTDGSA